jgi:hypothetical protein
MPLWQSNGGSDVPSPAETGVEQCVAADGAGNVVRRR